MRVFVCLKKRVSLLLPVFWIDKLFSPVNSHTDLLVSAPTPGGHAINIEPEVAVGRPFQEFRKGFKLRHGTRSVTCWVNK